MDKKKKYFIIIFLVAVLVFLIMNIFGLSLPNFSKTIYVCPNGEKVPDSSSCNAPISQKVDLCQEIAYPAAKVTCQIDEAQKERQIAACSVLVGTEKQQCEQVPEWCYITISGDHRVKYYVSYQSTHGYLPAGEMFSDVKAFLGFKENILGDVKITPFLIDVGICDGKSIEVTRNSFI